MKNILILIIVLFLKSCVAHTPINETRIIQKFQKKLNAEYKDPKKTPLRGDHLVNFKEHPFFPIDLKYKISAQLTVTKDTVSFEIATSSEKTKSYREYGKASFVLDGQEVTLRLYQSLALTQKADFEDHLFLPFRDLTNGVETYGGGKYLDLKIPKGETVVLDFNKSYHPFCAYNAYDYSCPIVPQENILPLRIEAGVMYEDFYHH